MQRALTLAKKGKGNVSPNPMVGCVIVKEGNIIGEGYHEIYGGPHAEVNAVKDAGEENVRDTFVFVTLEPCSHYGKTPPCAALLARLKPKKVIICNDDPNPLVAGKGINMLKEAGIAVEKGILEDEGFTMNRPFFTFMTKKKPYIILKWAQTADGFIARKNYDSKWISCKSSRILVHQWRADEDAIMIGTNTAIYDNPKLDVRFGISGKNPIRVVIDKNLKINTKHHLFDQKQDTLCYNLLKNNQKLNLEYIKLDDTNFLDALIKDLYKRKIQTVIVEGGSYLLNTLIKEGLWDEARVFIAPTKFQTGITAPTLQNEIIKKQTIDIDELNIYYKKHD